jgi:hypothetical protein
MKFSGFAEIEALGVDERIFDVIIESNWFCQP